MFEADSISWKIRQKTILHPMSFTIPKGEFLGLIGPNGAGKSSLMALLCGLCRPSSGHILLEKQPLAKLPRRKIARKVAFVEQQAETLESLTAREVAALGRTPHHSAFSSFTDKDAAIVEDALAKTDMRHLGNRLWHTLSGGEKQRLHFARALAQQTDVLLLDEPTNHLDIHHQLALLDLVRRERQTVVAALHDLNHAAMFCDRIAVLDRGHLVALGKPQNILTNRLLRDIFQVEARLEKQDSAPLHVRFIAPAP